MLPIMSLMLILIPFLVGNVAFVQLKTVPVSTPGASNPEQMTPEKKKTQAVMAKLDISNNKLLVQLLNEDTGDTIQKFNIDNNEPGVKQLKNVVATWKSQYLKLDSLLVSIEENVPYKKIVDALEKVKFPYGSKAINGNPAPKMSVVILPKGAA